MKQKERTEFELHDYKTVDLSIRVILVISIFSIHVW